MQRVVAGVLVGGRSRRMGRSKALLPHPHGGTFVEHVCTCAGAVVGQTLLLGDMERRPTSLIGWPTLRDTCAAAGPLAGLSALLQQIGIGWVLLLACDLPLLDVATLRRLLAGRRADCDAVAFRAMRGERRVHACCALYHTRVQPAVEAELAGRRRLHAVLQAVRTVVLEPSPTDRITLRNVNAPADLIALEHG